MGCEGVAEQDEGMLGSSRLGWTRKAAVRVPVLAPEVHMSGKTIGDLGVSAQRNTG